jgi:signal transduction histidine kinase
MDGSSSVSAADVDLRTVLDRMADVVFAVDADWQITYANDAARELLESAMSDDVLDEAGTIDGLHLWESIPEAVDTTFYERYHEALSSQEPVSFEEYYEPLDTWFDVRVFPSNSGLSVYLQDITEHRRLEQRRQESLRALQELYAVSSDRDRAFAEKLEAILRLGTEYLDVDNGFLTRIEQGTQYIETSVATQPELTAGESCPLDEAYCKRTIEMDRLLVVANAAEEGWEGDPAYDRFGLGTYIGGRVEIDGELYGTLCFADTEGRGEAFTDTQRTFVELLTRWVSYELERQQARAQLQRERDRLEEFASVVSHDLRNPLQAAVGRTQLLAEEVESDHLPPLERALSRMETLIEDLLTLAREGVQVEEVEDIDIAALAEEAWETTDTAAATLRVEPDRLLIRADESRLRQLLENLFRNAVEHGSTSPRSNTRGDAVEHGGDDVTVTLDALPDCRGFFVADDGPGIPPEEREEVFDAGYSTSESGTGFGLSIVSEIASAHGWAVSVTDADGGGARFDITGVDSVE